MQRTALQVSAACTAQTSALTISAKAPSSAGPGPSLHFQLHVGHLNGKRDNAWDPGPCRRSNCAHWPAARRLQSRTRRRCSSATCVYCDGVICVVAVIPEEPARPCTWRMCAGGRVDATPGHLKIIVRIGAAIGDMEVIPRIAGVVPFWQALAACHSTDNSVLRDVGDSHLSPQNMRLLCSYSAHTPVLHDRKSQVDVDIGAAMQSIYRTSEPKKCFWA